MYNCMFYAKCPFMFDSQRIILGEMIFGDFRHAL